MIDFVWKILWRTPLYPYVLKLAEDVYSRKAERAWIRSGKRGVPPPRMKHEILRKYLRDYGLRVVVETGTYRGGTVEALRRDVAEIYSIELSVPLYQAARRRFKSAKNVKLVQGDSGVAIEAVVKELQEPALFWLDGHYSGGVTAKGEKETPVLEELRHIFPSKNRSVILIDDAENFNGGAESAYPSLDELTAFVKSNCENAEVSVEDNIIRIVPLNV